MISIKSLFTASKTSNDLLLIQVVDLKGTVNQYIRRRVRGLPFMSFPCLLDIEQLKINGKVRHIELCEFVGKGSRYTKRFCRLVNDCVGICNYVITYIFQMLAY